jgi:hypothetical protein
VRSQPFTRTATITLNASGNGTAQVGPTLPGEVWSPVSVSISALGSIPTAGIPTVFLYAGNGVSAGTFLDSTYNVTGASSSMITGQTLYPGQQVSAVWSDGPASQQATIVVQGTRQVP